jgi:methylisocitrate lyase
VSGAGTESPGGRFRALAVSERPLQIVGTVNAYCAMLAREAGHKAIYLSGAGVANASYGLPDLGMTTLENVLEDARRVTGVVDLPLLVDIDTGWGNALNIARAVREMERAGVAAVHLEDQEGAKRCGHRPNKAIVGVGEMCDRVKAAVDGRADESFVIMARTDAAASEGVNGAVERSLAYVEAGADMIFAEALRSLEEFREFCGRVKVPVLANMTEFGKTPLMAKEELAGAGVAMVLYPLSAFRAMSKAALAVYEAIGQAGTQKDAVGLMQTREELYGVLDYHRYEEMVDRLNAKKVEET